MTFFSLFPWCQSVSGASLLKRLPLNYYLVVMALVLILVVLPSVDRQFLVSAQVVTACFGCSGPMCDVSGEIYVYEVCLPQTNDQLLLASAGSNNNNNNKTAPLPSPSRFNRMSCAIWTDGQRGCIPREHCQSHARLSPLLAAPITTAAPMTTISPTRRSKQSTSSRDGGLLAVLSPGLLTNFEADDADIVVMANNDDGEPTRHRRLLRTGNSNHRELEAISQTQTGDDGKASILYCCNENFCNYRLPSASPSALLYRPYVALALTAVALIGLAGIVLAGYGLVTTFMRIRKDQQQMQLLARAGSGIYSRRNTELFLQSVESWPSEFVAK